MMNCTLSIVRYPRGLGWAGLLSMALFRLPLWFNKSIHFWKLLGCGKNGSFDKSPDWRQWALLEVGEHKATPIFIRKWWSFFHARIWQLTLEPLEGHGTWDGKECFGKLPGNTLHEGRIAVLTRATIRISKLVGFWKNVPAVAKKMATVDGLIVSVGIGEVPLIKQATFSIWESKDMMKAFAYQLQEHSDVIRKTRKEDWYSEEMFVRFRILASYGSLNGASPLERIS